MQQHARVVIVGAGIVGCSVAYHLTKLGWRDIVVVEQGTLFETGGSTSHAPGLIFQINPSKTMTGFARYTTELFRSLELDGEACGRAVGSLEVAWTPERLTDLRRKVGTGMAYGVEAHLLSPREARDRVPMLSEKILGAMYTPTDVHTRAVRPAEAMARAAEAAGARFHGHTPGHRIRGLRGPCERRGDQPWDGEVRHCRCRHRDMGPAGRAHGGGAYSALADAASVRAH